MPWQTLLHFYCATILRGRNILVSSLRDRQTAKGVVDAVQSGHQVLTTLNASSALGIVERLDDFHISRSVIGSPEFLSGLVYQRLIPVLCQQCAINAKQFLSKGTKQDHSNILKRLDYIVPPSHKNKILFRGTGCAACQGLGIVGRTLATEIIEIDEKMRDFFHQDKMTEALQYWLGLSDNNVLSDNMTGKTVLEHGLYHMLQGLVSPMDIEELIGPVDGAMKLRNQINIKP